MRIVKWFAGAAIAVAAIDLMWGNTGKSPLPDAVANQLNQQTDLVLLGGGAAALLFLK